MTKKDNCVFWNEKGSQILGAVKKLIFELCEIYQHALWELSENRTIYNLQSILIIKFFAGNQKLHFKSLGVDSYFFYLAIGSQ